MHLLIITPIYYPSSGGASVYYKLLAEKLLQNGEVDRVSIITEHFPGTRKQEYFFNNTLEIFRLFPYRAGGNFSKFSQYVKYGIQNLLYFFIPKIIKARQPDIILIHSSFHNFFNLLSPVVKYISKKIPVVCDVRDHQLASTRYRELDNYHAIISCSLNVYRHLSNDKFLKKKLVYIPIIQEFLSPYRPDACASVVKYNLGNTKYFLFAGLIKPEKGINLLLSTFEVLLKRGYTGKLVLVGLVKDNNLLKRAVANNNVINLGSLDRNELLDLMSCSQMVLNFSTSEGMPRTSLEALSMEVKTILPAGIPEFDQFCHELVVNSSDPECVALQIERVLAMPFKSNYPILLHSPNHVLMEYRKLFKNLNSKFIR